MRQRTLLITAVGLALAGCGADDTSPPLPLGPGTPPVSDAGPSTLKFKADPTGRLRYTRDRLTGNPGRETISFENPSPIEHQLTIGRGSDRIATTDAVTDADTVEQVQLEAGRYDFFCTVADHRERGMEGTLVIE